MPKSFLDYAFDYMDGQANPVKFEDLWRFVVEQAGLSAEDATNKVARFYTNLILDGRFVALTDNRWDLKVRHKYTEFLVEANEDAEDADNIDAEDNEDAEYNKAFDEETPAPAGDDEALAPETTDVDEEQTL